MKFCDREKETEALRRIERLSAEYAQMTVITGRRRIGKTTLVLDEFQNSRYASGSVFSDIQNARDAMKDNSRINLILCGSVYSMNGQNLRRQARAALWQSHEPADSTAIFHHTCLRKSCTASGILPRKKQGT